MRTVRWTIAVLVAVTALVAGACTPATPGGGGAPGGPIAIASASPSVGDAPLSVVFDSSGSSPGTGTDLAYSWDFGDDSALATGASPSHVYTTPGSYAARLTMTTSAGSATSPEVQITVNVNAFHVATTGSTGPDCGPIEDPCSTISEAQTNAVTHGVRSLRVAGGTYNQPISLVPNMEISGGWNADFTAVGSAITTVKGDATHAAISIIDAISITGEPGVKIVGITAQGGHPFEGDGDSVAVLVKNSNPVTIGDLSGPRTIVKGFVGPNATGLLVTDSSEVLVANSEIDSGYSVITDSRSTYGIRALGGSDVKVTSSTVTAKRGVDGRGRMYGQNGPNGCDGLRGHTGYGDGASWGGDGFGGEAPNCLGNTGGRGGHSRGGGGELVQAGQPGFGGPFGGAGGKGPCENNCRDGIAWLPEGGRAGGPGSGGVGGSGGETLTTNANDLFAPMNGRPGTPGGNGGGGGGGGGGHFNEWWSGGGGSGGAGGIGGGPGLGGGGGGGSFGIYAIDSTVEVWWSTVAVALGGSGSTGGLGGLGGNGGRGGNGGNQCPESWCSNGGGGGGGGGAGAGGGGGAGGVGGPSIGILHAGLGSFIAGAGNNIIRPLVGAPNGLGGAGRPTVFAAVGGAGGPGQDGGWDGFGSAAGNPGAPGERGDSGSLAAPFNGLVLKFWDNGIITA